MVPYVLSRKGLDQGSDMTKPRAPRAFPLASFAFTDFESSTLQAYRAVWLCYPSPRRIC